MTQLPDEPGWLPVASLASAVRSGAVPAVELVATALDRMARDDARLGAFVVVDAERAMDRARGVDAMVAAGKDPGPLAGVPVAVKDVTDVAGLPTRYGSLAFPDTPAANDAPLVARLCRAGAVVVGKTATAELEFSATSESPLSGTTEHPFVAGRSAGGSSSGSAVAVASGMVPLATGTDGGGSMRVPAACCGLPALKLSLGAVPAMDGDGAPPPWPSLTSTGLLAADVASLLYSHDIVTGPYWPDPTSAPAFACTLVDAGRRGVEGRAPRIAWLPDLGWSETAPEVAALCVAAVERLAAAGASVVEVPAIGTRDPAWAWTRVAAVGSLALVERRLDAAARHRISPSLLGLLEKWGRGSIADWQEAEAERWRLAAALARAVEHADVLVCPTTAQEPPVHAQARASDWVRNTYAFNLARWPAASVPVGRTAAGLPIGLHLAAPAGEDLRLASAVAWVDAVLAGR